MPTDIDRLHKVVLAHPRERGAGRTHAAAHNLAGLVETAGPGATIFWVIPRWHWLVHIMKEINIVFNEHSLLYMRIREGVLHCERGIKVVFVLHEDVERRTAGIADPYFVDDLGECADSIQSGQEQHK